MASKPKVEIAKPLGDRVYKRQRKMIEELTKKLGIKRALVVQSAIEEFHAKHAVK